jgi:hypothetical protein
MSAAFIRQLQARGRRLAATAAMQLRQRVMQRWARFGGVRSDTDTVRLVGPGLDRQRRGTRARLAEPDLLWPGDR